MKVPLQVFSAALLFLLAPIQPEELTNDQLEVKLHNPSQSERQKMERCVKKLKARISSDNGEKIDADDIRDTKFADMTLTLEQCQEITKDYDNQKHGREKRKAIDFVNDPWSMWELPINYHIKSGYFTTQEKENIRRGFSRWERNTCIRFQEVTEDVFIRLEVFGKPEGCWSSVGFQTLQQPMNLQAGTCATVDGIIEHEIGHALGLVHEQQRPDRDSYITVHTGNIGANSMEFFVKLTNTVTYGVPYDFASVMHSGPKDYSTSSQYSMTSNDPLFQHTMGQRVGASFMDHTVVNMMYGCLDTQNAPESCRSSTLTCHHGGYPNPGLVDGGSPCESCLCPDGLQGDCSQAAAGNSGCSPLSGTIEVTSTSQQCLTSPGYPASVYSIGDRCSWILKAPEGSQILLWFDTTEGVGLLHTIDNFLCGHYAEIRYNGNFTTSGPRFCGSSGHILNMDQTVTSASNQVLVNFRAEVDGGQEVDRLGFKLCYRLDAGGVTQPPRSTTTFLPRSTTTQPSTTSTTVSSTISATTTTSATTTSTAASSTTSRPTALPWSTTTTTTTRSITPVSPTAHHGYYCHVCQAKYKYVCRLPNTVKRCAPGQACFSQLYWRGGGNNMYIVKKCVNWCSNPGYVYQSGGLVRYCCYGDLCNFSDIHYK